MTDISGIRIIVYLESAIEKIDEIIKSSFNLDTENSLDKTSLLSADQIGYRSVHYVCDLGSSRESLPEFKGLKGLKFEFQVRTVLQHAWAELAHDRNYKFREKLPWHLERKLYLYAGMLEIADQGFDELSKSIDEYISRTSEKTDLTHEKIKIDSINLRQFIINWADDNKVKITSSSEKAGLSELVRELNEFGVNYLNELNDIITSSYADESKSIDDNNTEFGLIRDWMLIYDYKKYFEKVDFNWGGTDIRLLSRIMTNDELDEFIELCKARKIDIFFDTI